jgi:hypothetical protein
MTTADSESFLIKEYDQCFEHMRHYGNMNNSLLEFSFGYYSAIAALSIGIYQFFHETNPGLSLGYIAMVLSLSVVIGSILNIQLVRYRKYFVHVARQVNRIRKYYIEDLDHFKSALPLKSDVPEAYNPKSTQILIIIIFIVVNAIFLGIGFYCFLRFLLIARTVSAVMTLIGSAAYIGAFWLLTKSILKKRE